jgi:hypothetical protein
LSRKVSIQESVEVLAAAEKIFDFMSNAMNDPLWRPEVEKMEMEGEPRLGLLITEYITIYRFFHIITPVVIQVLDRPHQFIIETPSTHPSWVHCIRSVEEIETGRSKVSVKLSFSLNNLRQILPFSPPGIFVMMWYRPKIRRYLRKLKGIMEA